MTATLKHLPTGELWRLYYRVIANRALADLLTEIIKELVRRT